LSGWSIRWPMPRTLVTGAEGFVGPYLARHLEADGADVWCTIRAAVGEPASERTLAMDITDGEQVARVFAEVQPDEVYHLAALARPVGERFADLYDVNLHGTIQVLEAAQKAGAAVLAVSSAYVYGQHSGTISEDAELRPLNHYGASKAAAEMAAMTYAAQGNRVVRVRPFNHTGPGQPPDFLVPRLVERIARVRAGLDGPALELGNLEPVRDFSDVRDVVRAYPLALRHGEPGAVYNVCSGVGLSVRETAQAVAARAGVDVILEVSEERLRETDIPFLVGDPTRLVTRTGWQPRHSLEETLDLMLERARTVVPGTAPR
jgi:GDP-4-dehydro-6-deoxy-D-mannose reductase